MPTLSTSIEDLFGITHANALLLRRPQLIDGTVDADYIGTDAISTKYDTLPIGSVIRDYQAYKTWYKYNATTGWKYDAWS